MKLNYALLFLALVLEYTSVYSAKLAKPTVGAATIFIEKVKKIVEGPKKMTSGSAAQFGEKFGSEIPKLGESAYRKVVKGNARVESAEEMAILIIPSSSTTSTPRSTPEAIPTERTDNTNRPSLRPAGTLYNSTIYVTTLVIALSFLILSLFIALLLLLAALCLSSRTST
jgi:hypothetical protein